MAESEADHELTTSSATKLARMIRQGEACSVDVVEAHLKRIREVEPALNAMVHVSEKAIEYAKRADSTSKKQRTNKPLHGVPITIKDNLEVAEMPTTSGAPIYKRHISQTDATVVRRLKDAGAIILGKTNLPLLGAALETDNAVIGRTNNPYDLKRTPGASSGDEAAIIAACGSPLGIGNDAGASIRLPAHFCGIAGLCPSYGRVSTAGLWPPAENLGPMWYVGVGPMARHVEDLRLTLPVIAGLDERDPFTFALTELDFSLVTKNQRIAYWIGDDLVQPTPETRETIETAARCLKDIGAKVSRVEPPYDLTKFSDVLVAAVLGGVEFWESMLKEHGADNDELMLNQMKTIKELVGRFTKAQLEELKSLLPEVRSAVLKSLRGYDAVICPVTKTPAVRHGGSLADISNFDYPGLMGTVWSLPSGTVRCGTSHNGLPIGVQIVGRPNREDIVLAVAQTLESQLGGWKPSTLQLSKS